VTDAWEKVAEAFIGAARVALREMAVTEIDIQSVSPGTTRLAPDTIAAAVELRPDQDGLFVVEFPGSTAAALARRMLTGVTNDLDDGLIRDCMGEIANVIAGQVKALTARTDAPFSFKLPPRVTDTGQVRSSGLDCMSIHATTDCGDFALLLFLRP
jgi:CheY-specific phosphatase CheX